MRQPTPANTDHLHIALKVVAAMRARPTGTEAFDRERHPHLMMPTRSFSCVPHHVLQASDNIMPWERN